MGSASVAPQFEIVPPAQAAGQPAAQPQSAPTFEVTPPDGEQPQGWGDTVERYALAAGHFLKSVLPHPEAPPALPASTPEDWAKLTTDQKQAFSKQLSDWETRQAGQSANIATGFMTPGATGLQDVAGQAPGLIEGVVKNAARKLYQSALKPSTVLPPGRVAAAVDTALANRIPVSAGGVEKLGGLLDDLQNKVAQTIQAAGPNRTISPGAAVKDIGQVSSRFANQVNPKADLQAIDAAKNEFLDQFRTSPGGAVRNMTATEAQAMKQGTYAQLKSKAYGELKSASIEAQKALARGIKEELANQFPELAKLNAKESAFYNLEPLLERAVNRISNHQIVGIGTPIAMAGAKAAGASGPVAAVTGVLKAVVDDPAIKSRLAMMLDTAASKQGITGVAGRARVAGWLNALARGALQPASPDLAAPAAAGAAQ